MPAKRPRFFEKTYEGRLFAGIVTANGPYVLDIASNRGTALYQSTIVNNGRLQWWIEESNEFDRHISLNRLSAAARKDLAYDFGLPFVGGPDSLSNYRKRAISQRCCGGGAYSLDGGESRIC